MTPAELYRIERAAAERVKAAEQTPTSAMPAALS
jgi:hypothetical protein